jgi:hypothetical protein
MADKKISQLTAAALPLAGTEVLPIVQSGNTVKVSSDDLTVKNVRSNATTGLLQVAGPGTGTTRVMTTPNANFTAARTDAGQTFTGNQVITGGLTVDTTTLLVDATNNLVGINRTPSAGFNLDVDTSGGTYPRLTGSDQANVRLRFNNSGSGGQDWELVGGLQGANNSAFSLYHVSGTATAFLVNSNRELICGGTTDNGAYNLQCNSTGVWGAGAYVNGSDARLKDNIQSLDSGLDVVKAIRPVTFQYKPEYSKDQSVQPGFIAQELQEAMAGKAYLDGVVQAGPEHLNVAYQNIIPILVKAIQELEAKIAALESK